jgi:flagellar biosynthesis chaperone FliJ
VNRRFRLAGLERLRSAALAEAARALGMARQEVVRAGRYRDRIQAELSGCDVPRGPVPPQAASTAASRRERLREDLQRAGEQLNVAYSTELGALAGWNAARADLRAVEVLHERHRLTLAEADARAEQRLTDELAATGRVGDPLDVRDELELSGSVDHPASFDPADGAQ